MNDLLHALAPVLDRTVSPGVPAAPRAAPPAAGHDVFRALWIGPELSPFEEFCLGSFVANGAALELFTYGPVRHVPEGCTVRDAAEILPLEEASRYRQGPRKDSLAAFSDVFRYALLHREGGVYIDTDVVALRTPSLAAPVAFAHEDAERINGAVMKFPAGHPAMAHCLAEARAYADRDMEWGRIGPQLVTDTVGRFGLQGLLRPTHDFYPLHWTQWDWAIREDLREEAERRVAGATFVHLWSEMFRRAGFDRSICPPAGSFLGARMLATLRGRFTRIYVQRQTPNGPNLSDEPLTPIAAPEPAETRTRADAPRTAPAAAAATALPFAVPAPMPAPMPARTGRGNVVNQISNYTEYDRTPMIFAAATQLRSPPKILSFGCSSGQEVNTLVEKYFPDSIVHGFDIDAGLIERNRAANAHPRVKYFAELDELDDDYDLVFCMSVLCRWPEDQAAYAFRTFQRTLLDVDRCLKRGGHLVMFNAQYLLQETVLAGCYEPLATPHLDSGFVTRYHSDFTPAGGGLVPVVFRKAREFVPRYGVVWANTTNLGDDIQTLAAIEYLRKRGIDEVVPMQREALDAYRGEPLFVLMNGWFMHDTAHFPPSEAIVPIFVSFHCAREELVRDHVDYFRRHAPIGCRDQATVELFRRFGVPAYFTGCLTLTFDPVERKGDAIYAVDIDGCAYIPSPGVRADALPPGTIHLTHELPADVSKDDLPARLELARGLLQAYQHARLVVTPRLHAALPCRAFGTAVRFVHPEFDRDPRFTGLQDVLAGAATVDAASEHVPSDAIDAIRRHFDSVVLGV